ncbi:unnamed protein product, partial [Polarella glacialis]
FDASSSRKSLKTLLVLSGCTLTLSVRGTGGGKRGKVATVTIENMDAEPTDQKVSIDLLNAVNQQ